MTRILLAGLMLVAVAGTAQAQRYTPISGPKLVELCTGKDKTMQEACTSYLDGMSDAVSFYQQTLPANGGRGGKLPAYSCVPQATTGVKLREAVIAWAAGHKEELAKQNAAGVAMRAIHDTFPCKE
jgi:hypothetical protein